MAGLEGLASVIYHEKQQSGSMLCAQHALNSLLQGNYFTAPDLSDIARNLDTLEEHYDHANTGNSSTNMDDTGFFSVQVLDNALEVWGLDLVRWQSEVMRPYHNRPHTQLGFILNLEQHWFTLRRFGPAVPNIDNDPGEGHWFNLNSFLSAPEWVGKLYLGMVLQQAEAEGYSVFVVRQANPDAPLALPRTFADQIASTLPEPTSTSSTSNISRTFQRTVKSDIASEVRHSDSETFEDDDYGLQAALQASLMQYDEIEPEFNNNPIVPPPLTRTTISLPNSNSGTPSFSAPGTGSQTPQGGGPSRFPGHADLDPVAASMERGKVLLQQMREQQEFAQREMWSEADLTREEVAVLQQRREARRREEEQEAEDLRKAIEESEALAKRYATKAGGSKQGDDEDEGVDVDVDMTEDSEQNLEWNLPDQTHYSNDRVYDDDDAELQAALKASLEHVPPGWQHPELPSPPVPNYPPAITPSAITHTTSQEKGDAESIASTDTSTTENAAADSPPEALTLDEIRRKRLAKFGL